MKRSFLFAAAVIGSLGSIFIPGQAQSGSRELVQEGIHLQKLGRDGEALLCFEKAGEMGNAEGQYRAGYHYLTGQGLTRLDEKRAVEWFQKSAEQGEGRAQRSLGYCYERGLGVSRDLESARQWYQKAAQSGDPGGRGALDRLAGVPSQSKGPGALSSGSGKQDPSLWLAQGMEAYQQQKFKEAVPLFRKAADAGNAEGQTMMGVVTLQGQGVRKDPRGALKWVRLASDQGEPGSQTLLAAFYLEGKLVKKDPAKAKQLLQSAAAKGNKIAQEMLSKLN